MKKVKKPKEHKVHKKPNNLDAAVEMILNGIEERVDDLNGISDKKRDEWMSKDVFMRKVSKIAEAYGQL